MLILWKNHKILPIMLELCLMLLPSYYAQNHAGIIGSSLVSPFSKTITYVRTLIFLIYSITWQLLASFHFRDQLRSYVFLLFLCCEIRMQLQVYKEF